MLWVEGAESAVIFAAELGNKKVENTPLTGEGKI